MKFYQKLMPHREYCSILFLAIRYAAQFAVVLFLSSCVVIPEKKGSESRLKNLNELEVKKRIELNISLKMIVHDGDQITYVPAEPVFFPTNIGIPRQRESDNVYL